MLTINSVDMDSYATYKPVVQDLDSKDTGRSAEGGMIRDRITKKAKIEIECGPLTYNQASTILSAMTGTSFSVTFFDIETGAIRTTNMYVGDRSAERVGNSLVEGLKFNLIEL